MTMAWTALAKRIGLAQRFFHKYEVEYAASSPDFLLLSPVSTAPEIYSVMPKEQPPASRVNYLYDRVPHHQVQLPPGYNPKTDWLPFHIKVPPYLEKGYPNRPPEDRPSTVYYSPSGERRELEVSSRSSYGAGPGFQLPEEIPRNEKGRPSGSSRWDDSWAANPGDRGRLGKPSLGMKDLPEHWGLNSPSHGLLASDTPFKSSGEFFIPLSPSGKRRETSIPGTGLPNPLQGMASAGPYGFSDESISQAPLFRNKGKGTQRSDYRRASFPTAAHHLIIPDTHTS
ncbi:hypothetical protein B0H15DRAFT_957561 [Mycena belliarum]|uniref:Uncharacterized protein n=1 Tax=Mycena belliarum TaxID=1033014 RepID=A0AAD6XGK5_9AGAR|nr:hypothetical protein B0H15DRAFT_957561 [Mycena belliae]